MSAKASALDIEEILERYQQCKTFWDEPYKRGQEDTEFVLGNQWPEKIKAQREAKGRPCVVENRMLPFVNQVINQIRQARPSIIPKPVDDKADVEVAEIMRGVIRNIEISSDADTVYDTAARNSVMGSVGWLRVVTDYVGADTFDQEVRLQRIQNSASVMLDPNHQRQDGADAEYGFVSDDVDEEVFEARYPDCEKSDLEGWTTEGSVRVAEYFVKSYEDKELVEFEYNTIAGTMRGVQFREDVPAGAIELRSRQTQQCKIKYAKICGKTILEEGEFAGEYIPLVPVYGFEVYVDGRRTFYSLIHQAKDPQIMLNAWKAVSMETVALQPKAPFIGLVGQFKTYAKQWASANIDNLPFLEADPVLDVNGNPMPMLPQRQAPPTSSGSMMQEAALSADAIKASLGMFDAAMGQQSNDISGKAIISRQMQGDNATFHFIDNLSVAIRHVGRIIIGLVPLIYTGNRIVRILGEDGQEGMVPLGVPVQKVGNAYQPSDTGKIISFDAGKYDVVVEVGPSYATRTQETTNALVELGRVYPPIIEATADIIAKGINMPNKDEVAKRIRAIMNPALLGDDVEAQRVQQLTQTIDAMQQKLDVTEQALLAKEQNQEFKNQLEAKKVENDTIATNANAAKTLAEVEKIKSELGGLDIEDLGILSSAIQHLKAQSDDVTQALHILLSAQEKEGTGAPITPAIESPNYVGQPDIGSA